MPPDRRSIGQVLKVLVDDFPDISISKIRFLETEGLLSPERAPSGYRRYSERDIQRLRYILDVQKNHYLPLKVIKENLDLMDAGLEPPAPDAPAPEPAPAAVVPARTPSAAEQTARRPIHITRRELLRLSGLSEPTLVELERLAIVTPRHGTAFYGRDALTVAVAARKLALYGMDARHLRAIKQAVDREVGLIDQAVVTHTRRGQAPRQVALDVMQLIIHAHAAILRQSISH